MMEVLVGVIFTVVGFLVKHFVDSFKKSDEESLIEIKNLNRDIIKLQGQIDLLSQELRPLQRIKDDVNEAHARIREIRATLKI
jgi:prefoldin subunit 5